MLQAGPKTSALVVTPSLAAAALVAAAVGAAAGALVAVPVDAVWELPQAASVTVRAAMAPMAASRWIFRTVFLLELGPVVPGRLSGLSALRRKRFILGM
jgi:hypothetical protein